MRCTECGYTMEQREGMHRYNESGLKNIHLMNVPVYQCPSCNETEVEIPKMEELHLLLGLLVVYQAGRLDADDMRYLRKHLGYAQEELAEKLGITRATIARWESGRQPIPQDGDLHLRRFYLAKKAKEFDSFAAVQGIFYALLDKLSKTARPRIVQIRKEDWLTRHNERVYAPA